MLIKNGITYSENILGTYNGRTALLITLDFGHGMAADNVRKTIKELEAEYCGAIVNFRVPWSKCPTAPVSTWL